MIECSKCKAQMDSTCRFCGVCGTPVGPIQALVIDGKKNRRIKQFFNRNIASRNRSAVFCVFSILGLIFSVWLFFHSFQAITQETGQIYQMVDQISQKLKYIKEGLPFSYIAKEIRFLADYGLNWIYLLSGAFLFLATLFYLYFFGRCHFLRLKFRQESYCPKPLALTKLCITLSKVLLIITGVFLALILLFLVIKYGIGVF